MKLKSPQIKLHTFKVRSKTVWEPAQSNTPCKQIQQLSRITRSSATAKGTARPSCLVGELYYISREKICWWLINHIYLIGHENYRIRRNNAKLWLLCRSKSFKVTDFGTNRKPICDFLLVININLPPIYCHIIMFAGEWGFLSNKHVIIAN